MDQTHTFDGEPYQGSPVRMGEPATCSSCSRRSARRSGSAPATGPHQREYVRWIEEAKREQTRRDRVAQAVEMLRAGRKAR